MPRKSTSNLTTREAQVLDLIGQGLNSRRVAAALNIAYFTVRKHRSNILLKLQLNTAAQLACAAVAAAAPAPTDAGAESASGTHGPP